jgi:hypothetical protein
VVELPEPRKVMVSVLETVPPITKELVLTADLALLNVEEVHWQASEADYFFLSKSGVETTAVPSLTTALDEKEVRSASPRGGKPEPVLLGIVHVHEGVAV